MFSEIVTAFSTARAVIYRSGSIGIIDKEKNFHIFCWYFGFYFSGPDIQNSANMDGCNEFGITYIICLFNIIT